MAINYPTTIDTLTNPASTDKVSVVDHASQHSDVNDIAEALEAKVGVDSSAVTTSHDYKLGNVTGSDKASSVTGTETLTNKSITAPVLTGSASSAGSILFKEDTDNGTNAVTLIGPAATADVTVTLPAAADTLVGKATTDTLTNKTATSTTNNVAAKSLHSATTVVDVVSATAPTSGQVLTATGDSAATWQDAAGVSETQVQALEVSLSAANLIAMNATPVEIIPAPGAGKIVVVDQFLFSFTYNSTQFTGGGDYRLEYGAVTGTNIFSVSGDGNMIKAAVNDLQHFGNLAASANYSLAHINSAINITNVSAAFATGNSTAKVFIRYRTLTL